MILKEKNLKIDDLLKKIFIVSFKLLKDGNQDEYIYYVYIM